ncbi:BTAD domain-containing putative transcriptional regulator [Aestuariivirga sp.]|uniref:BTAD domain-containing putative transcriptional regulator n=1 Tax=Aestuariivirga sp. TaxID=2650926 RepID=UPI00391BA023
MITLKLFGEMAVTGESGPVELGGAKLAGLLAVLALSGGRPMPRDDLAEMLWGSHFEAQAKQNLRQALSRLRKLLGPGALEADSRFVRIARNALCSDVASFEALSQAADRDALHRAAALPREELLAGFAIREPGFAEWLSAERRSFAAKLRALELRLAALELAEGRPDAALELVEALLRRDGLDEEAHGLRLRALAALGRRSEAVKCHRSFAEQLRKELGVAPEAATQALADRLKDPPAAPVHPPQISRPSLLVLPFATPGGEAGQDYFAEGMVDELITALTRLHWLSVLSRSSTFSARTRGMDARSAGDAFGVRYVLEGSIRRAGGLVRISGQLIETKSGTALWAERFDGAIDDIFQLQDRVAARVVGALQPRIVQAEIERSQRKPTGSLDAYDHYLRGLAGLHRWTREANREAYAHFLRATDIDPGFAAAYGMAARCLSQRKTSSWVEDEARERREAEDLAGQAVSRGPGDPVALSSAGIALAFVVGRVREGGELIERALSLSPGLVAAWLYSGWVKAWSGEAEEAIARVRRAIELSPHDPHGAAMRRAIGFAQFIAGRYEEALEQAVTWAESPQNAGIAAATAAASAELLGRHALAQAEMERLTLCEPRLGLANLRGRFPIVKDEDFARFATALRAAGLPESRG